MAVILVKITTTDSVTQSNEVVKSDPHSGLQALENLINKINCGHKSATVVVAVSSTDETITAQGGGTTATYNKN